ncbi:MAG: hypothetical protein J6Y82_01880 [Bacteroidales bacterium]|nr:hypothetical protein [Bacteroidales bacterium]
MRKLKKTISLAIFTLFASFNQTLAQDPVLETITVQKAENTQASIDALLQNLLIMNNIQTRNANSTIGNEDTPLSRTTQKSIDALTFLQNNVYVRKINVFTFTGLDMEVIGRVLVNERNKSEKVGTIILAEKNYATGKPGVFVPRRPFAYLNLNQVDSLSYVLNEIALSSYQSPQYSYEIIYVAEGGLMVQYYSTLQKVIFKNVAPSDRISNFDFSASKVNYSNYSLEMKVQKDLPQIAEALKKAKTEVENYLNSN